MNGPEAMKHYQQAADMSQHALAVAIGVTAGAISQYERGVNVPRRRVAEQIDEALTGQGRIMVSFGYAPETEIAEMPEVGQLRGDLDAERSERRSADRDLRDEIEELTDQLTALTNLVAEMRDAGAPTNRATTE